MEGDWLLLIVEHWVEQVEKPMGGGLSSASARRRCRMAAEDRRGLTSATIVITLLLMLKILVVHLALTTAGMPSSDATFILSQYDLYTRNDRLQRRKALNLMTGLMVTTDERRSPSSIGRLKRSSLLQVVDDPAPECHDDAIDPQFSFPLVTPFLGVSRSTFLARAIGSAGVVNLAAAAFSSASNNIFVAPARAFEGGIGGLGKTKPQTGVLLWDEDFAPLQNSAGVVTAELNVAERPFLVTFQAPWPLLPTTAGLEARDLQNSESAFVQVVSNNGNDPTTKQGMLQFLLDSVLSQQGKFGAYGAPIDVKVKQLSVATNSDTQQTVVTCTVPFTTYTPGLRESERQLLVKAVRVGSNKTKSNNNNNNNSTWILWIVGTTRQRFASQQSVLQRVLDSFQAVPAPASSRSSR